MQSPSDDSDRVKDNAVILMALLVTRFHLSRTTVFPSRIRKALSIRLADLIKRYKDPTNGISYEGP
jgi:hypothetical protein